MSRHSSASRHSRKTESNVEIYSKTGDRLFIQDRKTSSLSRTHQAQAFTKENTKENVGNSDLFLYKKHRSTIVEKSLPPTELTEKQKTIERHVMAQAMGINYKKSVDEFQKESTIKRYIKKPPPRAEDVLKIEELLKQEFRRRRTLHYKVDLNEKKYSISPAWDKLIVGNREKMRKKKERKLKKKYPLMEHKYTNGSIYQGEWSSIGMQGKGRYKFFYNVLYEGEVDNGEFYGFGNFTYPNGATITQLFINGMMRNTGKYVYSDKLPAGRYCEMPDRRFFIEKKYPSSEIRPAGRSYLTNSSVARKIPNGCYDAGDGFYNPLTKCVYDPKDPNKILRIPTKEEHKWILQNCRKAWDEVIGYREDLVPAEWKFRKHRQTFDKNRSGISIQFDKYMKDQERSRSSEKVDPDKSSKETKSVEIESTVKSIFSQRRPSSKKRYSHANTDRSIRTSIRRSQFSGRSSPRKSDFSYGPSSKKSHFSYATSKSEYSNAVSEGKSDFSYDPTGKSDFSYRLSEGKGEFLNAPSHKRSDFSNAVSGKKSDYSNATADGKSEYSKAVSGKKSDYSNATADGKSEYSNAVSGKKSDYSNASADGKSEYSNAVSGKKSDYSNASADGKSEYSNAVSGKKSDYSNASADGKSLISNAKLDNKSELSNGKREISKAPARKKSDLSNVVTNGKSELSHVKPNSKTDLPDVSPVKSNTSNPDSIILRSEISNLKDDNIVKKRSSKDNFEPLNQKTSEEIRAIG